MLARALQWLAGCLYLNDPAGMCRAIFSEQSLQCPPVINSLSIRG